MFTQFNVEPDAAFGGWLMPIVPPMVSAAAGALLIPHMQPGTGRTTMLYGCYAMFGLSLFAALIIISMIWSRLALYGTSGTARVPTLWIVLGPLGQGITAAGLLGTAAVLAVPADLANGMNVFAVLFGVPVWGFALLWIVLATELTVRTVRRGMPFALTWWSLTFPVGTFVTGTTQLGRLLAACRGTCSRRRQSTRGRSGRGRTRLRPSFPAPSRSRQESRGSSTAAGGR